MDMSADVQLRMTEAVMMDDVASTGTSKPPEAETESLRPGLVPTGDSAIDALAVEVVDALKTVYDPEIPVDIYELGLIYRIDINEAHDVVIDMTLTAPGCPVAGDMPGWVEEAVSAVEGVQEVKVNLVFDPPWDMTKMSEAARVQLNMY
jgi:FeS assembly SUF system protein